MQKPNQWIGFYIIGTSVMKKLNSKSGLPTKHSPLRQFMFEVNSKYNRTKSRSYFDFVGYQPGAGIYPIGLKVIIQFNATVDQRKIEHLCLS